MKIIVAETAGFCMGVRRAVDIAVDSNPGASGKIYTIGPLIHNNQTLEMLKARGIEPLDGTQTVMPDDPILIRAHGIPPSTQAEYAEKGHIIIDGTCPKVKTVHKVISKYRELGYTIIIAGDEGHAEVVGLMGYAGSACHLIQTPQDIKNLPELKRMCLVSQTTFDRETFDQIAEQLHDRFPNADVIIKKTICAATDKRQEEIGFLSQLVDAIIVVGGKNSANTLRLANIARGHNSRTQHVETEKEIDWDALKECRTVGITAGASTPHWMIKRVVDHLQFLEHTRRKTVPNFLWQVLDACSNMNFFIAAGASAMYFTSCLLQNMTFHWSGAILSLLYMLSMYLWNSLTTIDITRHLGISRYRFYNVRKKLLFSLTALSIIAILVMSLTSGSAPLFYLMLIATAAGTLYHFTIVPPALKKIFKYGNLKDIPTSRDLFVALAWGLLITFIPHAIEQSLSLTRATIGFFFWMFILAYMRSLFFDLRDIEGDRIMGRETLVTIIGEKKARSWIRTTLLCAAAALIALALLTLGDVGGFSASHVLAYVLQLPVLVYMWLFMRLSKRLSRHQPALFNILADGQFFVAGLCAFIVYAMR
jgi:(E)-4-hydroxy-3-methyl-but-2-enyl pyrophosphate reductase